MPLGMEVELGLGNIVLDGNPTALPQRKAVTACPSISQCIVAK